MKPNFLNKAKLIVVRIWLKLLNVILAAFRKVLFPRAIKNPKNILVYKLGNIGDMVCAMPALRAIKTKFPESKLTLLTSPGSRGSIGAKDFLDKAPYIDEIIVYYSDEVSTLKKALLIVSRLKKNKYDLFIQLPDDLALFRTILRNEIFAKALGVRSALGFCLRTSQLFKKAQVDFSYKETESVALLKVLARNGIDSQEIRFEFPDYVNKLTNVQKEIDDFKNGKDVILGVCMGGKTEGQKWPAENFIKALLAIRKRHKINVVFFGGPSERDAIKMVSEASGVQNINFAGRSIKESISAIRKMDIFLTNDTGPMHIAGAFGIPVIGLFSVKNVFGTWFPYGKNNICLHKKFFVCNYLESDCEKVSVASITVEEVVSAFEQVLAGIIKK